MAPAISFSRVRSTNPRRASSCYQSASERRYLKLGNCAFSHRFFGWSASGVAPAPCSRGRRRVGTMKRMLNSAPRVPLRPRRADPGGRGCPLRTTQGRCPGNATRRQRPAAELFPRPCQSCVMFFCSGEYSARLLRHLGRRPATLAPRRETLTQSTQAARAARPAASDVQQCRWESLD